MFNLTKLSVSRVLVKKFYKRGYGLTTKNAATQAATTNFVELDESHMTEAARLQPHLSSVSKQLWHSTHETFTNHGISTENFLKIVTKYPAILMRSPQKNSESIENWRSCQFGEKLLHTLLVTYPELLNESFKEHQILQRITFLKRFANTNKNVWKLIMSCPNVLSEREEVIESKMNYLLNKMRIEVHEIANSAALAASLNEIRCRHVFLERLNMFTLRSLKDDAKKPINNPTLNKITDMSDKNFAINVARVSVEEFEVFKELFAKELKRKAKTDEDDEDDDEL